jgi:hypothetical protein
MVALIMVALIMVALGRMALMFKRFGIAGGVAL